jgi:hypothetical protein
VLITAARSDQGNPLAAACRISGTRQSEEEALVRRSVVVVRKLLVGVVLASGLVLMATGGAAAKVHGVSQAGCAHDPTNSGANRSETNSPTAPIPVTASATGETASNGAAAPESGGDGDPDCDTEAVSVRQDP